MCGIHMAKANDYLINFIMRRLSQFAKVFQAESRFVRFMSSPVFDPSSISQQVDVVGIKTTANNVQQVVKAFASSLLKRTAVKPVQVPDNEPEYRIIILEPNTIPNKETATQLFTEQQNQLLASLDHTSVIDHNVIFDFKSFSTEDILGKLLPAGVSPVRSFESIGHIAHLNLRDEHTPHRKLIGEVILAKNPGIRTVVTKVGNIKTKFRTFDMEVIAGDDDTEAIVGESGIKFKLDFRKVYWNSRLGTEHNDLATSFSCHDVICDMFGGIGPFAIPAVKKVGCTVHANDLNPESYHYLNINKELNKIPDDKLFTYNLDGAEFVRNLVSRNIHFTHVIMNLPASAYTFLPVFKGIFTPEYCEAKQETNTSENEEEAPQAQQGRRKKKVKPLIHTKRTSSWKKLENNMPWIHCYGFSAAEEPKQDYLRLVEETLGCSLPDAQVKEVRDVSPHKRMILASFPLPLSIAVTDNGKRKLIAPESPNDAKKQKV